MSDDDQGQTKSSFTYSMQSSELHKNGHVVIDGRPCKIVEIESSQGTISCKGIDVFTGQLHECTLSTDETVDVPHVSRQEYALVNYVDGFLILITPDGDSKDDVEVPDGDLGSSLCSAFDEGKDIAVTLQQAMGEEKAMSCREAPRGQGY